MAKFISEFPQMLFDPFWITILEEKKILKHSNFSVTTTCQFQGNINFWDPKCHCSPSTFSAYKD
jgi:hypothetical protein